MTCGRVLQQFWFCKQELPLQISSCLNSSRCWVGTDHIHWLESYSPSGIEPAPHRSLKQYRQIEFRLLDDRRIKISVDIELDPLKKNFMNIKTVSKCTMRHYYYYYYYYYYLSLLFEKLHLVIFHFISSFIYLEYTKRINRLVYNFIQLSIPLLIVRVCR